MSDLDPGALARALSEIPLFREIQRVLSTQTGPVNWEIAGQFAKAVASADGLGSRPSSDEVRKLEEACRAAELILIQKTGSEPAGVLMNISLLDRPAWAELNLEKFRALIDRLADRLLLQMRDDSSPLPLQALVDALGPFMLGMQVGFLAGYLSRRVLGQYDVLFPSEAGALRFVYPNVVEVERELAVDPQQFRMWLALHEVTHQIEFHSVPWTRSHFLGLIEAYIDSAEIDSEQIAARFGEMSNPEELNRILEHPEDLLPLLVTPAQKDAVGRIQAFMSVLEGYAEWTVNEVGREMLPEFDKMREGMNRRRAERSAVERLLERLLGLDLSREQYRAGERFVRSVADAGQLSLLWISPESLPTIEEVAEPAKWLNRVAFS